MIARAPALLVLALAAALVACAGGARTSDFAPGVNARAHAGAFIVLPGTTASPANSVPALPGNSVPALPGTSPSPATTLKPAPAAAVNESAEGRPHVLIDPHGQIVSSVSDATHVPGYHPADLQSAYRLDGLEGAGASVALVVAFDDPNAEADLAVYRTTFGLAPCTSSNGCFRKIKNTGTVRASAAWAMEASLDLDMVSAICPKCAIVLVEAKSANIKDLVAAVDLAATYRPQAISNSYYVAESLIKNDYSADFNHPGIAITAASGDSGAGTTFPGDIPQVTSVGGTSLQRASNPRGWSEGVWDGSGYGCSATFGLPAWQSGTWCAKRWSPDVAAVGDPATGVAVYSSISPQGSGGWMTLGGTSVGAPIVAAVYAAANGAKAPVISELYAHRSRLFAPPAGAAGRMGLGSPDGTGAF